MVYFILDIETYPLTSDEMGVELSEVCYARRQREELKLKKQGLTQEELIEELKYFQYTKPWFAFIQLIGVLKVAVISGKKTSEFKAFYAPTAVDERALLLDFFSYIREPDSSNAVLYVHFNGLDFDIPFILQRAIKHNIQLSEFNLRNFLNLVRFRTKPHYDIMQIMSSWGRNPISLDLACKFLDIPSSKKTLGGLSLVDYIDSGGNYAQYNKADVLATYECFKRVYKALEY